jgi:hypothetical protein
MLSRRIGWIGDDDDYDDDDDSLLFMVYYIHIKHLDVACV